MFIVRKIYNSGSNVPDPIVMKTTPGTAYKIGTALKMVNGRLTNAEWNDNPSYIACESLKADEKSTIKCYPILPGMVFEVPIYEVFSDVSVGSRLALSVDESGFAWAVCFNMDFSCATVIDMLDAKKEVDKIFVMFDIKKEI